MLGGLSPFLTFKYKEMKARPKIEDYKYSDGSGYDDLQHHNDIEQWAEEAEQQIKDKDDNWVKRTASIINLLEDSREQIKKLKELLIDAHEAVKHTTKNRSLLDKLEALKK